MRPAASPHGWGGDSEWLGKEHLRLCPDQELRNKGRELEAEPGGVSGYGHSEGGLWAFAAGATPRKTEHLVWP